MPGTPGFNGIILSLRAAILFERDGASCLSPSSHVRFLETQLLVIGSQFSVWLLSQRLTAKLFVASQDAGLPATQFSTTHASCVITTSSLTAKLFVASQDAG